MMFIWRTMYLDQVSAREPFWLDMKSAAVWKVGGHSENVYLILLMT